jgi:hypothetical protein
VIIYVDTDIRVLKSRRMRLAGHVARMGRREVYIGFGWGNLRVTDHLKDRDIDGRIILKWIFGKWDGAETELICLRMGAGGWLL